MKKLVLIFAAAAFSFSVYAQSLQDGIKMVKYGRYESAISALQSQSGDEATYYLGLAQLGAGNLQAARDAFNKISGSTYGQSGLAQVLFKEGKKAEAMNVLQGIVDGAKKKDWEKYKLAADAITNTKGGDLNQAIAWYKKSIEIKADPATTIALGDAQTQTRSLDGDALNSLDMALKETDDKSLVYSKLGRLYYEGKNYQKALDNYELAKNADPRNPLPYKDLADAYYRIGKYDLAKQNIEKYLELSDKSIDDQVQYANILFLSKNYPEALQKMNELLKGGREQAYMYRVIGFSQYETKDYPNALNSMRTFFSKPKDETGIIADDYLYTGKIFMGLAAQDSTKAKEYADSAAYYFNKGVAMDTTADKSETYRELADALKESKRYDLVAQWYGKIVKETPDTNPEYKTDYFWWGVYTYYAKDYEAARKIFSDMSAKYPEEASPVYWLGRIAAAQDEDAKTGAAVEPYKKWLNMPAPAGATKSSSDLMQAYQYLAIYYYNKNDKAGAVEWSKKILEIEPDNKTAKQIIDIMNSKS